MRISVIIPAYQCAVTLAKVLEALRQQTIPREWFETIVVDDCSDDGVADVVAPFCADGSVTFLKNPERLGSGVARNRGLDIARGEIILFLDGDNVPDARCLGEHLTAHRAYPEQGIAVMGMPVFPRDIQLTPLMRLDDVNRGYAKFRHFEQYDWQHFSTMHISLKRSFIGDLRFDEGLFARTVGFEDTDFAFRLHRRGLRILYDTVAVSYHYHFRKPEQFLEKTYRYGKAFRIWLDHADAELLNERAYISGYLPSRAPKGSLRYAKYAVQRAFINDATVPVMLRFAKSLEARHERASVFVYRRMYNYFFQKGYHTKGGDDAAV